MAKVEDRSLSAETSQKAGSNLIHYEILSFRWLQHPEVPPKSSTACSLGGVLTKVAGLVSWAGVFRFILVQVAASSSSVSCWRGGIVAAKCWLILVSSLILAGRTCSFAVGPGHFSTEAGACLLAWQFLCLLANALQALEFIDRAGGELLSQIRLNILTSCHASSAEAGSTSGCRAIFLAVAPEAARPSFVPNESEAASWFGV